MPGAKPKQTTIGALIDQLAGLKAESTRLEREKKANQELIDAKKAEIIAAMDEQETTSGTGKKAAASICDKIVPHVVDWDKLYAFITEKGWFHLLQRRPSTPGCTELFESGVEIPGVEQFKKRDVNLRSI